MAENNSAEKQLQPRRTLGQRAKQAGLFMLFGTILMIPRIRRLRRRVWAWTTIRIVAAVCGGWLVWRYAHLRSGATALVGGLLLFLLSLLLRAKPVVKSVDDIARELGALIVLNGGTFQLAADAPMVRRTQIFVHPTKVIVQGAQEKLLVEIPMGSFRSLTPRAHANGSGREPGKWELEIEWMADALRKTTFFYEGPFAEHLAQVAESTLRSQWKKELPVIPL